MNLRLPSIRFAPAKELTGRKVLLMLVAFFGVVMVVNFAMVKAAISTFGGVDTPSSYEAGRTFKTEEARAAAQNARDWQVDEHLSQSGASQVLTVNINDDRGTPVTGVDVAATLAHPIDERRDVAVALAETGPGAWRGSGVVSPGVWQLDIIVSHDGEQLFRSRNRVIVP
jgi:nitrogen fixation protein FixH